MTKFKQKFPEPFYLRLNTRQEVMLSCPRVAEFLGESQCEHFKFGKLPSYAMYEDRKGSKTDEQVQAARDKARCKLNAHYIYSNTDGSISKLCSTHVYDKLYDARWNSEREDEGKKHWYQKWGDRLVDHLLEKIYS
ncbi:hypothetical protein SEA_GIBBLES_89 [Gordonia phage Gibbles]|uniref:Uncharacterized protein n=3 Tax=Gordonia phage Orchid TaxID=1838075 RepID=A0A160DHL7_9CAUD|nr:hypothetical protein BH761_gp091 [Gordonia phage Orchid]ANA87326.1 hypothetical protein PBI_PATRICKSTAR_92 [Gordonia phage PatrickStar]ANA87552.1 hypothetical protein PBI_KAMPE_92 [Gordonia phage Kampe]AXH46541.1 hypothetical protein SEA_ROBINSPARKLES_94 [Gordonia phage RobinSparkles]QDK02048.1 hypothetical protein SEA_GIBBLES_89 [Gordonia phage Gibbles]ANA87437.1 hypothetical protein PBI_ORCHID_91 [Gordonia phage Orchid]